MRNLEQIQRDFDYLCNVVYKIENKDGIQNIIMKTFDILSLLDEKKLYHKKHLSKQIDETIELFELVNLYEKNRGYEKLAKQANLLRTQYEKYKAGEKMKNGLKAFFDDYSGERLPSRGDILTLAAHNIKQVLILANKVEVKKAKEIAYDLVKIVLNEDKKFSGTITEEGISLESNNKIISMPCYPKTYGRSVNDIYSDCIRLFQ